MANTIKKEKAVSLRLKGRSINEISEILNVPKSTVSVWCRNIKLGPMQIERLAKRVKSGSYKGRIKFLEKIRNKRLKEASELRAGGLKEIGKINKRDLFVGGIAMYLSEGATSSCDEKVAFTNSDPQIILFMMKWFKEICGVSNNRFALQVRINKIHSKRINSVENYWSQLTDVPLDQFTRTILIKTKNKKLYSNNNYYGTLRVLVHRGTQLRRKLNGWIDGLITTPG